MKCYQHPDRDAIGVCVSCGKPICEECLVEVEGKNYCKSCAADFLAKATKGEDRNEKQFRYKRYWEKQFEKFHQHGFRLSWNWPALLLGPFWYLFKGMWIKAFMLLLLVPIAGVINATAAGPTYSLICIYTAILGNWDLYLYRIKSTHLWKGAPKRALIAPIVLVLWVILMAVSGPGGAPPPSTPTTSPTEPQQSGFKDINATVMREGETICITNDNDWAWPAARLEINNKYSLIVEDNWPSKAKRCYYLNQFTKSDGTRFNILITAIKEFHITVTTETWPWGSIIGVWTGY